MSNNRIIVSNTVVIGIIGNLSLPVLLTRMIIRSVRGRLNGHRLPDAIHRTGVGSVPVPLLGLVLAPVLGRLPVPVLGSLPTAVHPPEATVVVGVAPAVQSAGPVIAANGSRKTGRLHVMIANDENTKKEGRRRTGRRKKRRKGTKKDEVS